MSSLYIRNRPAAGLLTRLAAGFIVVTAFAVGGSAQSQKQPQPIRSILGVKVGMTADEADEALTKVGSNGAGDAGESEDGESKEVWTIQGTEYAQVVIMKDKHGHVAWVSGFVRPGSSVIFDDLGDVSAARVTRGQAVWNVRSPSGGYKLVAKGRDGHATVVYLISLATEILD